ncbi:MAG: regulatory iron-sulfur-containing complex subunit RicT, partial [Spirochaetota bacterium]
MGDDFTYPGEEFSEADLPEKEKEEHQKPEETAAGETLKAVSPQAVRYRVKIIHSSETAVCVTFPGLNLKSDDYVIVPSRYGKDIGKILGPITKSEEMEAQETVTVIRKATDKDLKAYEENKKKEEEAIEICKEKILLHGLDMKLVSAHYIVEESKMLFFFTAEARVDFRELVKDLVSVFKMRIELRQIGVRDEARVLGGLGVCGRLYCCYGITDKLKPVSIKMAKEQNLSLNSMKISGPCGRLLCCLSYEYDFYNEEKRKLPAEGIRIKISDEMFKVTEVNILARIIRLTGSDGRVIEIPCCRFV